MAGTHPDLAPRGSQGQARGPQVLEEASQESAQGQEGKLLSSRFYSTLQKKQKKKMLLLLHIGPGYLINDRFLLRRIGKLKSQ